MTLESSIPDRGVYVATTQMAEGYVPPSASLNPAASVMEAEVYELRTARRELAEALVRVTEERDRLRAESVEHSKRHAQLFGEVTRELDHAQSECHRIAELNRVSVRLLAAERDKARADVEMYGTAYHAIQKVLDGAIGGGLDDGEGAGIVADVALVVRQRDDARQALERVATERDEARAEVVELGRALEAYNADYVAVSKDLLATRSENVRLRTIITELGAAEAAEPPEEIEALRPDFPPCGRPGLHNCSGEWLNHDHGDPYPARRTEGEQG